MPTPYREENAASFERSDAFNAFLGQMNFPVDDFQLEAMDLLEQGTSVIVCAPTGSGKTLIAEYAAYKTLHEGGKLFYTSPLKALSNQKFQDLKARFGEAMVGLLTGDMSVNRDARIVVMTTEVFRNMLYGLNEDSSMLDNLSYVVLDECHFMNDADRGTVWEESIVYCPANVKIIGLSATVANAEELTRWIDHIHPKTQLVFSSFRPVPLRFFYFGRRQLFPLFEQDGKRLNKQVARFGQVKKDTKGRGGGGPMAGAALVEMIEALDGRDMLPAIVFTFSRKGCERSLRDCTDLQLLPREKRLEVEQAIDAISAQTTLNLEPYQREALMSGVASHHAGLLPGVKLLVESLFQRGLLRVVFATETLAAGINMPARTTVISSISKRCDVGHRTLTASEFLQMSGRAGRRGMDVVGHVVVVGSAFDSPEEMAKLASSPPDALNSQFTPTYGMVLNLLQKSDLEKAGFLVNKSFGAFTSERRTKPLSSELNQRQALLSDVLNFACPHNLTTPEFEAHIKQRETLALVNKQRGRLQKQARKFDDAANLKAALDPLNAEAETLTKLVVNHACNSCELLKQHRRLLDRSGRLEKQIDRLEQQVEEEKNVYWLRFMGLVDLLKHEGYLDGHNKPTGKGLMASKLRTENELFLSELLFAEVFNDLDGPALAALVSAIVNDSGRDNVFSYLRFSRGVRSGLAQSDKIMRKVGAVQKQFNIDVSLHLNSALSALVEAWAKGTSWDGILASSSVDGGDLVRNVRRTIDVLRQLSQISEVAPAVAHAAYSALVVMNREPVKEVNINIAEPGAVTTEETPQV